jgi:PAS domain-containing protein
VFKASRGIEDIYELTYIRKDGSRFPAVVSVTALRDDQSAIIGYLLIGTDNTARKQVEAERILLDQRVRDQQFYTRSLNPGMDFAWIFQPCDELAGDGLNIIPLGNGKVGLYVLDVSGHGVAAALLSVTLSRLLSPPSEPSSILIQE